ncbi:MAG: AAA family ATPase [Myxococcaceae bacterium]|jgi:ATP-dependent RNA/DNA helicase IGHMBP2|nr:AAA family ATPase [Myxococcaceae bacterium]MCA3013680.1 AAA family ATPase [Myxococcaceae bacterium]
MARDATHFDALARLLELERRAERERLATERAALPLAELEARGLVVLDVESVEESIGLGGRTLVTFQRDDKRALRSKLHVGDLVTVSPRKAPVERPPSGVITRATRQQLEVAFERHPPPFVGEGRLRIDLVANDVTFDRARGVLRRLSEMTHGQARDRQQLVLGALAPRFERRPDFTPSRPLNPEQLDAVGLALSARDVALVHGPPGTGKSTVLAEVAVQAVRRGQRLLCTAASNAAVDHLLELCLDAGLRAVRVGHPARVLPHLQAHTVDLLVEAHDDRQTARALFDEAFELLGYARKQRSQGRSRERFSNARAAKSDASALMDEARGLERKAVDSVLGQADVVCATLSMLDGTMLSSRGFDLALLDEATQALEPLALGAFLKAPTVILAGDPKQLAATVISMEAKKQGLGTSLFERVLEDFGDEVKRMLKEQHRMHAALMALPSRTFYGGELRAHPAVAARTLGELLPAATALDAPPLLFLDTAGKGFEESKEAGTESLRNEGEARLVVARATELVAAGLAPEQLAVITPYSAQAALLRELLAAWPSLEVDTIDAFQGREKEAVLLSLVRSNGEQQVGFLEDLRRMNVAITRARRHLFAVGDSATLSGHEFYAAFVEEAQAQGGYRSAWEWPDAS